MSQRRIVRKCQPNCSTPLSDGIEPIESDQKLPEF